MIENSAVTLLDEPGRTGNASGGLETLRFKLDIAGERLGFGVQIVRGQVRLSDIVPLARALSERLCRATLQKLRAEGSEVPCRKGCAACCSYLVPLSVPEVFRLREDISALPGEQGRAVLNACLSAAGKILEKKPDNPASGESLGINGAEQADRIGQWYAGLNLPCPFLSEDVCISYRERPIACREHFVTSPAALCLPGGTCETSVVPTPVSILECLGRLCAELEQREVEAVILPLALPWALKNHERSGRTWPTGMMVERFIEILKAAAAKTRTPDAVHV
jgi:Fe-S-cluster containining protein